MVIWMDKLLLTSLFAMIAGFLTAALSFVKLVNDKESRITDYRQEWTNSARESLAKMMAGVSAISVAFQEQANHVASLEELEQELIRQSEESERKRIEERIKFEQSKLKMLQEEIIELRHQLRHAYHFTSLHFKPNDPAFSTIEHKFDLIVNLLKSIPSIEDDARLAECRGQIDLYCSDLLSASKSILKNEWERIKVGEVVYKTTKNVAKWGATVMLFLTVTIAAHALIVAYKTHPEIPKLDVKPTGGTVTNEPQTVQK